MTIFRFLLLLQRIQLTLFFMRVIEKGGREEEEDDDLPYEDFSEEGEQEGRAKLEDEEDKSPQV